MNPSWERSPGEKSPVRAAELAIILAITVGALVLRGWALASTGIGQYDEGVYAFTGLGLTDPSQPHRIWPLQERISPPVYFLLGAAIQLATGVASDRAAILVSVIVGTLTVPLLWWVGRRWFGPTAGVGAAALLALNEFHILLSRSALTDVTFAFAFLLALAALVWAQEESAGVGRAVLAGVAVGVAWNTKYHGWFALVIVAGALAARVVVEGADRAWRQRAARSWTISAIIAGISYIPWQLYILTRPGSVVTWSGHYARMLDFHVFANIWRHAAQQFYLDGPFSRSSLLVAVAAMLLVAPRRASSWGRVLIIIGIAGGAALAIGSAATMLGLALLAVPRLLQRRPVALSTWVVLGWLALWVVAAPLYRPYFRLLLPFVVAMMLVAVWWLAEELAGGREEAAERSRSPLPLPALTLAGAGLVFVVARQVLGGESPAWRETRGMTTMAARIAAAVRPGAPIAVVGEPALAYYLHTAGHPSFGDLVDIPSIDSATTPGYLVTGIYARRAPVLRDAIGARRAQLRHLGSFRPDPTDLRLLDDYPPAAARRWRVHPDSSYDLELYEYQPLHRSAAADDSVARRGPASR